jgi:transcriptional regulator with XRE-family HTH domain
VTEVADLIGSSQSRVAKMEAGDPSVSVDLLIRALLALGARLFDHCSPMVGIRVCWRHLLVPI